MNTCLHRRFATLAHDVFNCDSYWMDTPCIPEDHELRDESIANINRVFANSKATLICDRDLMEVDVSELASRDIAESSLRVRESLLAVLLVCDWNIRAWTLLEAMRGRKNIHILCKNNAVVSLKETLDIVCHYGSVDIAILFLTAQHLLPSPVYDESSKSPENLVTKGLVSLEEAGSLLSHRHASRDGDDIVIWSLLFHEKAHHSPEAMWRSRIQGLNRQYNLDINTGFLLSSAPRLKNKMGLSWAPARPAAGLMDTPSGRKLYLAYSGADTSLAEVTPNGLNAAWFLHRFPGGMESMPSPNESKNLSEVRVLYLQDYRYGALLQPISMDRWGNTTPARYEGNASGPVYAVCGSDSSDGLDWVWRGVFEWDIDEPVPQFESEMILLI